MLLPRSGFNLSPHIFLGLTLYFTTKFEPWALSPCPTQPVCLISFWLARRTVALTVIHSSSLTNRIRAKRKKISGSSSKVPSAHLRGSGLETTHTLGPLLSSLFLFLLPWDLVDGWAGSCWWAEDVEIRSNESGVDLWGRFFLRNGWKVWEAGDVGAWGHAAFMLLVHGNRSVWRCY